MKWLKCGHAYKLYTIDGISEPGSEETIFGTLLHDAIQKVLVKELPADKAALLFARKWNTFYKIFKKKCKMDKGKHQLLLDSGVGHVHSIEERLKKKYGNYKVIAIEHPLESSLEGFNQKFKGFIDIVLDCDGQIKLLDFKTSSSIFFFKEYQDKFKDYQLVFYKHFFAKEKSLDIDKIDLAFVILEKTTKEKNFEIIDIPCGQRKIDNAMGYLNKALKSINSGIFLKNRTSCEKFCSYKDTIHCPSQKNFK